MTTTVLPIGAAPQPVASPHFPDRLYTYVWRNWQLVPLDRMAQVVGAQRDDLLSLGRAMGLAGPPPISAEQQRRSAITVIRRNWHLLPYEQLLDLLGWSAEQLDFALREDDFLYIKLGNAKPRCAPLTYSASDERASRRAREIAAIVRREFPAGAGGAGDPFFSFVHRLSQPSESPARADPSLFAPRFCYSYFALYGDPLLEEDLDPYPDGYLARLAARGVDGVWLQGVLPTLAPFPWDERQSARHQERLAALRTLVARARRHGIGVYLYLNEPRSLPVSFYRDHAELQGVTEGEHAALCTSVPAVQQYLTAAVATVCRAVPDLAGLFTITASENFTNCWSHHRGAQCPRCGPRGGAAVIAELNNLIHAGIQQAGSATQLLVWDWGWRDEWVEEIIARLPVGTALTSVSEWDLPIVRGGVESVVGEYSLSAIGPGPRATRHWALAKQRGLKTIAKIQAATTWELSAVPYIPAVENAARHAANLRASGVDGLMLGWTLGGYPSPNLEAVAAVGRSARVTPEEALEQVARRRFGAEVAPVVVTAWRTFSAAFGQFPYHIGVAYHAPTNYGPANPLWEAPTGYSATMLGFPYDDLDGWRAVYPPEVFAAQLEAVATGFQPGIAALQQACRDAPAAARDAPREELHVAEAAAIHFGSTANQARFVLARGALAAAQSAPEARGHLDVLEQLLSEEIALARRLHAIQMADARIGFEASNQYYYVPLDLVEKVLNCYDLRERWLTAQRARWGLEP